MPTYVALLRGINLGARNRVAMDDLRAVLAGLGYGDVRTHLQSGNAVFTAPDRGPGPVAAKLHAALDDRYDFDVPVIVRTAAQVRRVATADPHGDVADDPARYLVQFADGPIPKRAFDDLDRSGYEPERLAVRGSEAYLWLPGGLHRSRLAPAVERRLTGLTVTVRNWRTVLALAELTGQPS